MPGARYGVEGVNLGLIPQDFIQPDETPIPILVLARALSLQGQVDPSGAHAQYLNAKNSHFLSNTSICI